MVRREVRDMRAGERSERGLALVAVAVWLGAVLALAAIAIEVAHLTTAATEVQVASDSAALAAAVALSGVVPARQPLAPKWCRHLGVEGPHLLRGVSRQT